MQIEALLFGVGVKRCDVGGDSIMIQSSVVIGLVDTITD